VFYVVARTLPHLGRLRPASVLIPIRLLHSLRQLGLMFLTRGATYPGLPPQFAYPAALGDLLSAVLAFVALFLVSGNSAGARPLVWVFSVFGTVDSIVCDHARDGLRSARIYGAGLLDSGVLGSFPVGYALHNVSDPYQALEKSTPRTWNEFSSGTPVS